MHLIPFLQKKISLKQNLFKGQIGIVHWKKFVSKSQLV